MNYKNRRVESIILFLKKIYEKFLIFRLGEESMLALDYLVVFSPRAPFQFK
jgi:hypothetical protein